MLPSLAGAYPLCLLLWLKIIIKMDYSCALAAMAWLAVMAIILYTSSMQQPRERSFTRRAIPCRIGPLAVACPRRSTSF